MAGRLIRVGKRKPFLGHPEHRRRSFPPSAPQTTPPHTAHRPAQLQLVPHQANHKSRKSRTSPRPVIGDGATAFFDGAFERGQAAFGAVVYVNGEKVDTATCRVTTGSESSSNVAEYAGVIEVLRYFKRRGFEQGTIYGDSLMVCQQLNGRWKARAGLYMRYYREAIEIRRTMPGVEIVWIRRELNTVADALSKTALRASRSRGFRL